VVDGPGTGASRARGGKVPAAGRDQLAEGRSGAPASYSWPSRGTRSG